MKLSVIAALACFASSHVFATESSQLEFTEARAKAVISDYRTLRSTCAQGSFEKRAQCMSKLSDATENYQRAKQFLKSAKAQPSRTNQRYYTAAN